MAPRTRGESIGEPPGPPRARDLADLFELFMAEGLTERRWRLCRLELESSAYMSELRDVTELARTVEALNLAYVFAMSVHELVDLLLSTDLFEPIPPSVGPRLARVAAAAGVDPTTVLEWLVNAADPLMIELDPEEAYS